MVYLNILSSFCWFLFAIGCVASRCYQWNNDGPVGRDTLYTHLDMYSEGVDINERHSHSLIGVNLP